MTELLASLQLFHFLRPWWWLALVPLLACWWQLRRQTEAPGQWGRIIDPALASFLLDRTAGKTGNLRPWGLNMGALVMGIIAIAALAGPTWSKKAVPVHRQEQALVILFDLSPSMLASDVLPDRLTRARLKAIDLLNAHKEGTVALIAYAGDAHVVTPLTDDAATVISQLPVLHPNIMPSAGSNPEAALDKALELAMNAGHLAGDILLITDGLTPDARENIHTRLRQFPDFRLSILGVGSEEGAPIPLTDQGFARDGRGAIVIAHLNSEELQGLAERNGGVYRTLTGSDGDIQALLKPLQNRTSDETRELERNLDVWEDRGIWLALLLLPAAALLFRRGLILSLALLPLAHSPQAEASIWSDLWRTGDQQGLKALEEGNPKEAQALFTDPRWQGVAASRAGDFEAAAKAFAEDDSADGHYNRGTALAKAGQLDAAIAAYDEALKRNPDMADARANKALVEQLKNQQEQQQQQQQQQDNAESGNNQQPNQQPQAGEPGQPNDSQQKPAGQNGDRQSASPENDNPATPPSNNPANNPDQGEHGAGEKPNDAAANSRESTGDADLQPAAEAEQNNEHAAEQPGTDGLSDAERQNAEQWLRRVPDDPGGLLRNKFQYEAQQRFRAERSNPRMPPNAYSEERW